MELTRTAPTKKAPSAQSARRLACWADSQKMDYWIIGFTDCWSSKLAIYPPIHLSINPFFVGDYQQAAANYSSGKVSLIISILREYDLKAKVIVTSANAIAEGANVELIKNYAISETIRKPFSIQKFQEIVKQVLADNYTYKDYLINKNEVISIQVSPTAEKLIHTIDSLLWNMKLKFEKYTLDYTVEELFCDQMTHENFKKQKEVLQKAINLFLRKVNLQKDSAPRFNWC